MLIDLTNGQRNVYSHNDVCLEFFGMAFEENLHYTCIACRTIDSVMNFDKKNHLQVYSEKCKYRVKKHKCQNL